MPKGRKGEERPADVIGNAVLIGRIATGELGDRHPDGEGGSHGVHSALHVRR